MKLDHLLYSIIAGSFMLTGCLSEPVFEPDIAEDGIPINLDGSISQIATKVNAQGFESGDGLGLYAVNYENSNQTPGTLLDNGNQADHVKYVFDESSWTWTPVKPVYYKDINTNVDLYAFYPHAKPSSVSAYNFEVQKDQSTPKSVGRLSGYEASDFLWGKTGNVAPTESKIKVKLNHMMAGVNVILKEGTGFETADDWELIDKKVLVTNTTRKASINLATGEVSPIGEPQTNGIVMALQTDDSFRAIVVPQTVMALTPLFSISIDGTSYGFKRSDACVYVPGKLHTFTITINRKYPEGEYEFILTDTQINDWKEDLNTHEGEARQYYCVNVEEAGTLGEIIKKNKKNPNKIKNLKISGKIHGKDFRFMRDSMELLQSVNLKEAKIMTSYRYRCRYADGSFYNYHYFSEAKTLAEIQEVYPEVTGLHWDNPKVISYENEIPHGALSSKKSLTNFVFPEVVTTIRENAFSDCTFLSGALIIPDDVSELGNEAFKGTNISSLSLPHSLTKIGNGVFRDCKALSGHLQLPNSLVHIGQYAFWDCSGLTGSLTLPGNLSILGSGAFMGCSGFVGSLTIPESLCDLYAGSFAYCNGLNGQLVLHDNLKLHTARSPIDGNGIGDVGPFELCSFQGELNLPANITNIPKGCFVACQFSSISGFPEGLLGIGESAFSSCTRISGDIDLPASLVSLERNAFDKCLNIQTLKLPASLNIVSADAFKDCFGINKIIANSSVPPVIQSGAFDGVAKDNFTVEVPANAVKRYQADSNWGEFKRITAHYDFSISRSISRSLTSGKSQSYILRAPANYNWSIERKPEWISISPSEGIGKTEVTITFEEMSDTEVETFDLELTDDYGNHIGEDTYAGRAGEIVFKLNDVDYTISMKVEQYDYEYNDGDILQLHKATKGNGIDIVLMGDCYDAKDIAKGSYLSDLQEAFGYFFNVEPYATYKDYFNVYAVFGVSADSGIGTVNTIRDAKFGSQYALNGISPDFETCYEYAQKADAGIVPSQTLIILIENTTEYGGICYMWGDGTAIACCPKSNDAYPYDFRGIVQHEAGGHGFGKLADEYIYHNAFISTCRCPCCEHLDQFVAYKELGWYRNLETTGDPNQVGWAHLIFNPKYSNVVDVYEGGYYHTRGVYRSEPISCMNNNIPYFSAISRQAIVERIMEYADEEFTLEKFYANDNDAFGVKTKGIIPDMTTETSNNGMQHGPIYMGYKPEFLK